MTFVFIAQNPQLERQKRPYRGTLCIISARYMPTRRREGQQHICGGYMPPVTHLAQEILFAQHAQFIIEVLFILL